MSETPARRLAHRKVGRPPNSGPEAAANPLNAMTHEQRRDLFLSTAAHLFETKGFASTAVDDITGELGLSKGIFYYYWKNKGEILQEIHDRALSRLNAKLDSVLDTPIPPEEQLEIAIRHHIRIVMEDKSLVAVLLGEFSYSESTLEARNVYAQRFQTLIEKGIADGVVRDGDPKMLTFAILGLCNSIARWYQPQGKLSAEEVENLFADFARSGYAVTEKLSKEDDRTAAKQK